MTGSGLRVQGSFLVPGSGFWILGFWVLGSRVHRSRRTARSDLIAEFEVFRCLRFGNECVHPLRQVIGQLPAIKILVALGDHGEAAGKTRAEPASLSPES